MSKKNDPDDELFAEAMRGVKPVQKIKPRTMPATGRTSLAKPAHKERPKHITALPVSISELQDGDQPWTLCVSGVSRDRLRRLAAGSADHEIDLHGSTRDEALKALESIVTATLSKGTRTLCVVHGRGLHSQGKPVLKHAVFQWLREGPYATSVLAVVPRVGSGGGASMVLFRRVKGQV